MSMRNEHLAMGIGTVGNVVSHVSNTLDDAKPSANDIRCMCLATMDCMKTDEGIKALRTIACAVLNRNLDQSHFIFKAKDNGDIGVSVLSDTEQRAIVSDALQQK